MGDQQNQPFQLSFNPSLKVDFQGSRVTSDGGLLLVRELDERLVLSELIAEHLTDSRGKNTQLPLISGFQAGNLDPALQSHSTQHPVDTSESDCNLALQTDCLPRAWRVLGLFLQYDDPVNHGKIFSAIRVLSPTRNFLFETLNRLNSTARERFCKPKLHRPKQTARYRAVLDLAA